jgi:hypothetical protein
MTLMHAVTRHSMHKIRAGQLVLTCVWTSMARIALLVRAEDCRRLHWAPLQRLAWGTIKTA